MNNFYTAISLLISGSLFGQIEQNINKTTGTISNPITEIDSIRFNGNQTEMEIILQNGSVQSHGISTINNVTFSGQLIGEIASLNCAGATINGTLVEGVAASAIIAEIGYAGGNGGPYNGLTINSTGINGLAAELTAGNFANGAGTLSYNITGTTSVSGTAIFAIATGGQTCMLEITVETGGITSLVCDGATTSGTLVEGVSASGFSSDIPYIGGNGGSHNGQTANSTGVTGLTATLSAGAFANGSGSLAYIITGIPSAAGTASFFLNIGGKTCTLNVVITSALAAQYPIGSVFCASGPTAIVEVTNPATGKTWMDRNLGASQVATSSTNANAYGDLYQWGRRSDGHQCRTSITTTTISTIDQPVHGDFILSTGTTTSPYSDWRSPQNNNLWQGVNGVNNPCPSGYRLPTEIELNIERLSWSVNTSVGAFISPLKLPMAGNRLLSSGALIGVGTGGSYWSSTVGSISAQRLFFDFSNALMYTNGRANGLSVRCLKN
jgi:hypothetical protein